MYLLLKKSRFRCYVSFRECKLGMFLYPRFFYNGKDMPSNSWRWRMGSCFLISPRHEDVVFDIGVFPVKSTLATICNDAFFKRCICVDFLQKMIEQCLSWKSPKLCFSKPSCQKPCQKPMLHRTSHHRPFSTLKPQSFEKNIWTTADHDGSMFLVFFFAQRRLNSGNRMGCEDVDLWLGKRSASVASQLGVYPANANMNVYDVNKCLSRNPRNMWINKLRVE